MQLYLEGGAWFKKKSLLEKMFSGWLTIIRKGHKMSAGLMARRRCKTHKTFIYIYMKHLILTRVRSADPHVTLYSSLCITKVYKQTWKQRKTDQFLERLIPPCLSFPFWLNSHLECGYSPSLLILPGLLRSDQEGLSASSPSGEWKDACGLHGRWLVYHVNQVIQSPFLH